MSVLHRKTVSVALAFMAGAILLSSCGERAPEVDPAAAEAMMTEYSENLTIIESQNGKRSYRFTTPLVEGYSQAREPYREFRKGIRMVTYQDDSLASVDVVLTANYAIYYEKRKLWEAKGNVVVEKSDGKKLYTQQLFWNATTKKVYSNVDTRIVQEGRSDAIGAGFETDEEFRDWRFRYMKGQTDVDVSALESSDSTRRAEPAAKGSQAVSGGSAPKSSTANERKSRREALPPATERDAWPAVDESPQKPASHRLEHRLSDRPAKIERIAPAAFEEREAAKTTDTPSNPSASEK